MTINQYLDSLTFDDGAQVQWGKGILTQGQLATAGGRPYVLAEWGSTDIAKRFHQGLLLSQLITLSIHQEPTRDEDLPSAAELMDLWGALFQAPEHVDEGTYGYDIIQLEYAGGFAPDLSERSSGLRAAVRLRYKFSAKVTPLV